MRQGWLMECYQKSHYVNGLRHRENGPAIITDNGSKSWFKNGQRHREDGPAFECYTGNKLWWLNDIRYSEREWKLEIKKLQTTNKAAVKTGVLTDSAGTERYYLDYLLHREGGPALIYTDGTECWYRNGHLHREDGAACNFIGGHKEWWIDGRSFNNEEEFKIALSIRPEDNKHKAKVQKMNKSKEITLFDTIKKDSSEATFRTASKQVPKAAREILLKFMQTKGISKSWLKVVSEMAATEEGRAFVSLMMGWVVKAVPAFKDNVMAHRLAEEWRVDAIAAVENSVLDQLIDQIGPLMSMIKDIKLPDNLRVDEAKPIEASKIEDAVFQLENQEVEQAAAQMSKSA